MAKKWTKGVFKALRRSWRNGRFCDLIIKGTGFAFKAHKVILASTCQYFDNLFEQDSDDYGSAKAIVYVPDFTAAEVGWMLRFAYEGEVTVSAEDALMFLKSAQRFGIRDFEEDTSLNVSNNERDFGKITFGNAIHENKFNVNISGIGGHKSTH